MSLSLPAGLDITTAADDPPLSSDTPGGCGRCQRMEREEPLDAILSPELDQMVTDGECIRVTADSTMEQSDSFLFLLQEES